MNPRGIIRALSLSLLFETIACTALADDWTLPSGRTYKDVQVRKITETKVSIIHASGMATFELTELGEEILEALEIDQDKLKKDVEAETLKKKRAAEVKAQWKKAERIDGTVTDVLPSGIIVKSITPRMTHGGWVRTRLSEEKRTLVTRSEGHNKGYPPMAEDGLYFIEIPDTSEIYDGLIFDADVLIEGTKRHQNTVYRKAQILKRHTPRN